jgi:hypothetical protein
LEGLVGRQLMIKINLCSLLLDLSKREPDPFNSSVMLAECEKISLEALQIQVNFNMKLETSFTRAEMIELFNSDPFCRTTLSSLTFWILLSPPPTSSPLPSLSAYSVTIPTLPQTSQQPEERCSK